MAISVTENLVVGHRYRYSYGINELIRVFFVEGLTPGTGTLVQASVAVDSATPTKKIPAFASPHPDAPLLVADDFDINPFPATSQTSALVKVLYHPAILSPTFQPVIEFNGVTRQITTNYDSDGNVITVDYTPPGGTESTEVGQVSAGKSYGILTIERTEYEDPTPRLVYLNKVNSAPFWGTPKWTWICRDISIRKVLYTAGFNVKYTFEYDEKTHTKTAIYRDTLTGDVPKDINTNPNPAIERGNGWTNVFVQGEINYAGLSLPNGFAG